jgi:hypothetical protein
LTKTLIFWKNLHKKKEPSVSTSPFARIAVNSGILRFVDNCQFPDDNQGALAFGNASMSNNNGGIIDLNGFSQTICDIVKDPNYPTQRMVLTSQSPATLTVKGTFYRYGFYNWKNMESKEANFAIEGRASYELDSRQSGLSGRWQQGDGHTYFTNVTSTTRGYLSVVKGTIRLGADTSWPNLSELRASNKGILLVDTSSVNPGKFIFSVSDSATVTIAGGVTLDAKKAIVGGTYLEPGVYGGVDAGLDEDHTLSCLLGKGLLIVRRPQHPGMAVSFK